MQGAGEKLFEELAPIAIRKPVIPYLSNVTADYVTEAEPIKELLKKQVSSSVRFQQIVERMIRDGVDTFIEIGPGKTLSSFIRKVSREVKVYNIDKLEDLDRVVEEISC